MSDLLTMGADDAREVSEAMAQIGAGWWRLILWAYRQGLPEAEGLTRKEWRDKYYGGLTLQIDDRREAHHELVEGEGLPPAAAAEVTGSSRATVYRDLVSDETPEADGKADDQGEQPSLGLDDVSAETAMPAGQEQADTILADIDQQIAERVEEVSAPAPDAERDPEPEPPRVQVNEGDEWYTPKWLFDALGIEKFWADVCAPPDRTHSAVPAERHFTIGDDGLAQTWDGLVWCNPPYSKPEPWARRMIHHSHGGLLLTHIPMNAGWCVDMWERCDAIRLFQAMEFVRPDGTSQRPGYWLQLAAFGPVATEALARLQPLGEAAANKRRVASPMWRRAA